MTRKKAIFFDWYNTLASYHPAVEDVQLQACCDLGLNPDPKALWRSLPSADQYFYQENARSPVESRSQNEKASVYFTYEKKILEGAGLKVSEELIGGVLMRVRELTKSSTFILFEDVIPVLRDYRNRGLILGMISNIPKDKLKVCQELGLSEHLDFIVTPLEAGADKPDKAIFIAALKKAGVRAEESVHVGDQYHSDIVGARGAGIDAVLIDRRGLFSDSECTRISSLKELAGIVEI